MSQAFAAGQFYQVKLFASRRVTLGSPPSTLNSSSDPSFLTGQRWDPAKYTHITQIHEIKLQSIYFAFKIATEIFSRANPAIAVSNPLSGQGENVFKYVFCIHEAIEQSHYSTND